tara:strand:+ start:4913 stop:5251 length:339 start_codon:yes stop_codon:yes gene_type:complete
MADQGFNGTTVNWGGLVGDLVSVDFSDSAEGVDITSSTDPNHIYVAGINDPECTIEVVGGFSTAAVGTSNTLTVTWNDTTTTDTFTAVLLEISSSGSVDDKISTTLTFKPSA